MTSGSFMTHSRFVDNKNYPRGLSRHGHFTIKEAQLLEKFGVAFNELDSGKRLPATSEEESFVLVCRGQQEAITDNEKVWIKYLSKIKNPKKFHTLSGGKPAIDSLEDFSDNEV